MPEPVEKCYPSGVNRTLTLAGAVLLAAGAVLLFVCVPHWAWLALLGLGLIAAGLLLVKLGNVWR